LLSETKTNRTDKSASQFFWFETPEAWQHRAPGADTEIEERTWLMVRSPGNRTNGWFICSAESEVNSEVAAIVKEKNVPNYFGVDVEIAGKRLGTLADRLWIWHYQHVGGGKTAGEINRWGTGERASTILATAASSDAELAPVKVNIYLTS